MNPSVLVALANLQRRRRRDTAPRAPFANVGRARRALAEDGVAIAVLSQDDLPALTRLADAVSGLADCLALRRPPASRAVDVINELASGCTGTVQLIMGTRAVQSDMSWHDPDPVAGLARRVIEELDGIDLSRLRQCQRKECDLLFFDMTRSRSQRWHAENPCGWLERQHRRRSGLPHHGGRDWRAPAGRWPARARFGLFRTGRDAIVPAGVLNCSGLGGVRCPGRSAGVSRKRP